ALERFVELAAKDGTEHLDGKKEVVAWLDPARAIGRQPTCRHQWSQPVGQCEDNMDVTRWEKLLAPRCEPAIASSCLTLRAVPISARVVGDGAMSTASAFIDMAAECSGT